VINTFLDVEITLCCCHLCPQSLYVFPNVLSIDGSY
jgi:hypothetical protein